MGTWLGDRIFTRGGRKISLNLMDFYNDLAVNVSSALDFSDVDVNKLYLFNANSSDWIVPIEDQNDVLNAATTISQSDKEGVSFNNPALKLKIPYNHISIKDKDTVITQIKVRLE